MFFHCQMADKSGFFMMECLFNLQTKALSCTIKTTRPELDQAFVSHFKAISSDLTI